jgi:hypothetical protein
MDAGMAIKPIVSVVNSHAQPAVGAAPAAPPILPPAKTVSPAKYADPARNQPKQPESKPALSTTRDTIIDPQTREVVYRVLDARTRQVVNQAPDQAVLRMQAYARAKAARALADGENPIDAAREAAQKINSLA